MVRSPSKFLFVGDSFLTDCDLVYKIGKSGVSDLDSPPPKMGGASIGSYYEHCMDRFWRLLKVSYLF
jgi:hypothetical protein